MKIVPYAVVIHYCVWYDFHCISLYKCLGAKTISLKHILKQIDNLHDLSISIAAQYENCQCSAFKQCTWSRKQLEIIQRLSKNLRRGPFKYFQDRICDFKSQKVYCCKDQTAPRTNGHIEYLKKKSLEESSRSSSSGTCILDIPPVPEKLSQDEEVGT